jgi:hypothetical protein
MLDVTGAASVILIVRRRSQVGVDIVAMKFAVGVFPSVG